MKDILGDQLIGTWKLESGVENPVDGSAPVFLMGEPPMSIIMFTQDGYMAAQLMRCGRQTFASGDEFNGTIAEYWEEASTYIAYSVVNGDKVKGQ